MKQFIEIFIYKRTNLTEGTGMIDSWIDKINVWHML